MTADRPDLTRLSIDRGGPARRGGRGGWWVALLLLLTLGAREAWHAGLLGALDERPVVSVGNVRRAGGVARAEGTSANGYVVARRRAALSTDIQGRLVELLVEEGDHVETGDLVARLDTRELEAARTQVEAQIRRASATLELAEAEYARQAALFDSGDTSASARDNALAARDEAKASLDALRAQLDEIDVRIDKSSVYAPFSGVITAKDAEVGEVVSALGAIGPNARGAVATLVDFETLEVQVELSQSALAVAREGAPVRIYLDAFPTDAYPGRVRQIWPMADRTKATVEVRVVFLERDDRILPEMGVRAVFLDDAPADAGDDDEDRGVYAPAAAVVKDASGAYVFLLEGETVVRRDIAVDGEPRAGEVRVAKGLQGNERVVLSPAPELADGARVRVES